MPVQGATAKELSKAAKAPGVKAAKLPATPMRTVGTIGNRGGKPLPSFTAPKPSSGHSLFSLHTLESAGSDVGKAASKVGHEVSLFAQAKAGDPQAARELGRPIERANEKLQSPATAKTFAKGLRAAGVNIDQESLEKVGKSLARLPEDVAYMPKGTVESVIHPVKGAKEFGKLVKETVEHPTEHADFLALMGIPALNRAAGRADAVGAAEATGVGDVNVRPLAKTKSALRKPSFAPQTERNLAKRVVGGPVKAGRVDYHVGSQRQLEHLQRITDENAMRQHTSKDKAVNEALPVYGEGLIKPNEFVGRPGGRVASATIRIKQIKAQYKGLNELQKVEADHQIALYEKIKGFTPKQHEEALRLSEELRAYQHPKSLQAAYEGAIQPNQLRARYMGFALTHGGDLGRGDLSVRKGAVSPLIGQLRDVNKQIADTQKAHEGAVSPAEATRLRTALADLRDHRDAIEGQLHESHGVAIKKLKIANGRILTTKGSGVLHDHLVDAKDQHVPWHEIEKLYDSHGHKNPPLYVSQTSKAMSSEGPARVQGIPKYAKPRSGVNFLRGTYDTTLENLRRSNVGMGNTIAKAQGKRALYRRFGHEEFKTPEAGEKAVKAFNNDPANKEFIQKFGLMVRTSRGPERFLKSPAGRESTNWLDKGVEHEANAMQSGPGKYTMMPQKILDRLEKHENVERLAREPWSTPLGAISKGVTAFRKAVLMLNPHWWAGVPMEYMVRGLMGDRPGMGRLGGQMMDRWREIAADPSMPSHMRYEALKNVASFNQGNTLGGWVGDLMESNNINDIMRPQQSKWGALMDRTPKGLRLWKGAQGGVAKWLHYIEQTNNRKILGQIAHEQIKQTIKETHDLIGDMNKFHEKWAEGKLDPNEGDHLVERLVRNTGNWHHLTPFLKQMRMYVLPFGMWTVNALAYLAKVMPRDYPGRTMLIAALSQGMPREHLPLYLQGTMGPISVLGAKVRPDPFYYLPTSLGREAGEENGKPHLGLLEGTNPIFSAIDLAKGDPQKAAEALGEAVVPAAGQLSRSINARQGPAFGLVKTFSPLRLAAVSKKEEEGKKAKFTGGFAGKSFGKSFGGSFK